jgi:hypothetical protein
MAVPYQKYLDFLKEIHLLKPYNICNISVYELTAALTAKNKILEIISISPILPRNDNEFKRFLSFLVNQFENEVLTENETFIIFTNDYKTAFHAMKLEIISIIRMYNLQLDC